MVLLKLFKRISKRERYIASIAAAAVTLAILNKAVFSPIANRLDTLNKEILLQEKKLEKSLSALRVEDLINAKYKKDTQNVRQNRSDEEEIAMFLSRIEKTAKKTSVFLTDMKPALVKKAEFYNEYAIEVEAESKISNLVDFIYQLEKVPQLLRVGKFYLTLKEKNSSLLKIQMSITEILITASIPGE